MSERLAYFLPPNSSCFAFRLRSSSALMASMLRRQGSTDNGAAVLRPARLSELLCSARPRPPRARVAPSPSAAHCKKAMEREGGAGSSDQDETSEEKRKRLEEDAQERDSYLRSALLHLIHAISQSAVHIDHQENRVARTAEFFVSEPVALSTHLRPRRRRHRRVVNSFRAYHEDSVWEIERWEANYRLLPAHHKRVPPFSEATRPNR